MFRLAREVRFAVNTEPDGQLAGKPTNAYGGFPSLTGLGHHFTLAVTLEGDLDTASQYVRNIKEVDDAVRRTAIPRIQRHVRERTFGGGAGVVAELYDLLKSAWPGTTVTDLRLGLSPTLSYATDAGRDPAGSLRDHPMVRLSQKFEFSASHRLHNPALSDDVNRQTFGKCNNPLGHGHNYEVQVTLAGEPDASGSLMSVPVFERIVTETVIDRFDHKNLNLEVPEFRETIPSVENIARAMYRLLKPQFADTRAALASVTVWETPKTWCEYSE